MSDSNYEVGFGRPPQHSRFKTGQSGNPKGRPRGSRNMKTMLRDQLDQKIQVTENGRTKTMSKREVSVRQLVDKAVKGDHKALTLLLKLDMDTGDEGMFDGGAGAAVSEIPIAAYDDVVAHFLADLQSSTGGSNDAAAAAD